MANDRFIIQDPNKVATILESNAYQWEGQYIDGPRPPYADESPRYPEFMTRVRAHIQKNLDTAKALRDGTMTVADLDEWLDKDDLEWNETDAILESIKKFCLEKAHKDPLTALKHILEGRGLSGLSADSN